MRNFGNVVTMIAKRLSNADEGNYDTIYDNHDHLMIQ